VLLETGGQFFTSSDARYELLLRRIRVPLILFGLAVTWAVLQTIDLPMLSSQNSVFQFGDSILNGKEPTRLALDQEAAISGIIRWLSYAAVFWLIALASVKSDFAHILCRIVVAMAVGTTALGLFKDISSGKALSGTFVNPSNYGTYIGLACLVCLGHLQKYRNTWDDRSSGCLYRWRKRLEIFSGEPIMWVASLLILLGGLVLSYSRGAVLATLFAGMGMTIALAVVRRGRSRSATGGLAVFFVVTVVAVSLVGEHLVLRFDWLLRHGESDRLGLFHLAYRLIAARPWVGWGVGAFPSLYPILQPTALELTFDHVHNTFLESAVELGIAGAVAFNVALAWIGFQCLNGIRVRSRDHHLPAIGFGAVLLVGSHSVVDFSVQIPAVTCTFVALLAMGWAQAWSSRQEASD
jgi:O-antigen ligase